MSTFVIRGPEDALAMVPVVMGHHPAESLVAMGFGPRSMHQRMDHPETVEEAGLAAMRAAEAMVRNGIRQTLLVSYAEDATAVADAGEAMRIACGAVGIAVVEHVWSIGERWRTVTVEGVEDEGTVFDVAQHPLYVRAVADGNVIAGSREGLAETLAAGDPIPVEALEKWRNRYSAMVAVEGPCEDRADEGRWVQRRVRAYIEDGQRLEDVEAGRLLAALCFGAFRDVALAEVGRDTAQRMVDLFGDMVRRSPDSSATAHAAALHAFAAWQAGQGALAWCGVDRSRATGHEVELATLMDHALTRAVPPHTHTAADPETLPIFTGTATV